MAERDQILLKLSKTLIKFFQDNNKILILYIPRSDLIL